MFVGEATRRRQHLDHQRMMLAAPGADRTVYVDVMPMDGDLLKSKREEIWRAFFNNFYQFN